MSGAGHMLHAIKTLKANRHLLKKRVDQKRDGFAKNETVTKVNFKKSTAADMIAIRKKIKQTKAKELRLNIALMITSLIIFAILVWYFFLLFFKIRTVPNTYPNSTSITCIIFLVFKFK